ncbi:protocatechuate 3,4-dioxygenase subunit alpha [Pelagibacterium xiamenense]|uniref:protocatechuate 3,4-dioxygenase subunit alpha n=1 Tax=Pelagibacterium xiamenense TaxID=2901140 RepID=UPI001E2E99B1|nr:protocatechuate 3,4-dioxygenase subunit alpha [Pelagibacterium xiamenense]MCD7060671.1 protocatechuate 3,4-dioxygenase subunit alpha [Pelagibacterium xiamenense]
MVQALNQFKETPSQTAGPYVHIGAVPNFCGITGVYPEDLGKTMVSDGVRGERITVTGRVIDGGGNPVGDCVVEIWQADAGGIFNSPEEHRAGADPYFTGFGRCPADTDGRYSFETIKPGPVPGPGGATMAPHITFWIVARGINIGLHTRMYFSDEETANAQDPVLAMARPLGREATLIGKREGDTVRFDIHLQGENETVFFDV